MALKNRQFLEITRDAALAALSEPLPSVRLRGSMVQLYFGDPRQHYELWLRNQAGLVEIGLHFEGERDDSLVRIARVAEVMPEVGSALGPSVEAEEWTERWTRVHETLPLEPLTEEYAQRLGERLARFVTVLEPLVASFGPMAPRPAIVRGRWEGRRRARRRISP